MTTAVSTAPGRPARRPLDQLSLSIDDAALEAASAGDPAWLADDRRAAFEAWRALPGESNVLYTPYIDLRAAQLEGPDWRSAVERNAVWALIRTRPCRPTRTALSRSPKAA
ncbi:MAG: hypothetical protein WKF78_00645 [Candidatus Limnocylindrales bacterium]